MQREYTPLIPGFEDIFRGRKRLCKAEILKRFSDKTTAGTLPRFRALFKGMINCSSLNVSNKPKARKRVYTPEVTFWAWIFQLIGAESCAGAVKQVQSWQAGKGAKVPSANTSAYCRARFRLSEEQLGELVTSSAEGLRKERSEETSWLRRQVKVVDGTGLSMPDTKENQHDWPSCANVKPGCGFPQLRMVGLFCLFTGGLLKYAMGNKHDHESSLWMRLWSFLEAGDVVLGDRGFGSFVALASLLNLGVDSVCRLSGTRKVDWRKGKRLGERDRLQHWSKPRQPSLNLTNEQWRELPQELVVRVIQRTVDIPGFRSKTITIVTTLIDAEAYPATEIFALYRRRWLVEVWFRVSGNFRTSEQVLFFE